MVVLDMRDVVSYTDFLVIATGNTERQTQAIEDAIYQELKHARRRPRPHARAGRGRRRRRAGS